MKLDYEATILFLGIAFGVVIGFFAAFYIWSGDAQASRVEAIEQGHAEWVPQPDGSTEFRWKECE